MNNINQSLFVFFARGCNGCQYCFIHSVSLTVIKFLIIFMFVEVLIKKLFQSCKARTGFTPIHDAFVVNDLLDQVFFMPLHGRWITWHQHIILMIVTNKNRVCYFWASQTTPFGFQGTELWEPSIYIWVFFFESSI